MRNLQLSEGAPAELTALSDGEAAALASLELATVARVPGEAGWQVAAAGKVGVVRVGDLQVAVLPKVPIERIVFMMGYARSPKFWREHPVQLDAADDLADALAETFRRWATAATEPGLLHGYVSVEEALPVVRGKIRVGEQISRRLGRGLPVEVTYDDFTADIAENRILLTAALMLLRVPDLRPIVRRSLQRLRLRLADVTPLRRGEPIPRWQPSRLNVRYQPALQVAELILSGDSFEQRVGDVPVSGFVFEMWKIYEDFVTVGLKEALRPYGGLSSLQHKMYFDVDEAVEMKPDFVWFSGAGAPVVVDAKYKAEKPSGFPQADLYQLLAYCTVFGVDRGHLVYAEGNETATSHTVVGAGVRIECHTLNLDAPPEALIRQLDGLASELSTPEPEARRYRRTAQG